jgi:hypothetical protein
MTAWRSLLRFGLLKFGLAASGLALAAVSCKAAEPEEHARSMTFEACVGVIESAASHLGLVYADIADTDTLRVVRFPVSDGSVLVTCSRFDDTMVVTKTGDRCGVDVEC